MRRPQKRQRKTVQIASKRNDLCAGVAISYARVPNMHDEKGVLQNAKIGFALVEIDSRALSDPP